MVACVFDDVTLDKVLKTFMTTYKHLLVVYKHMDPSQENPNESEAGINPVVGLITLEVRLEPTACGWYAMLLFSASL